MIKRFAFFALLFLLFASCGKDNQNFIPNVLVNFRSPVSDPRLQSLNSPGGSVIIDGYGVSGIVIYRKQNGDYAAYDRCSSYQPEKRCAVTIDNGVSFQVVDPCSGSKFSLEDGSPVKAPASRSLKPYTCYVRNFEIFVSN